MVADHWAELRDPDAHIFQATRQDTRFKGKMARQAGVIEAKHRTDSDLAADMRTTGVTVRAGVSVGLKPVQDDRL